MFRLPHKVKMSDLQKYIEKRKRLDKEFAENYGKSFEDFKTQNIFAERAEKGDWEKAREILAKAPNIEVEDYDKL